MKKLVLALALVATSALADEFPVKMTDQDANILRQICDVARTSTGISLESAAGASQYCVTLISRIATAAHAAEEAKKNERAKPEKQEVPPPSQ